MPTAAVQSLSDIAKERAAAGDGWAALTARMAADTLVAGALLQESDGALLDIGPLRSLSLDTDVLPRVHDRYRQRILQGLQAWNLDEEAEALLGDAGLPDLPLHAGLAGEFAEGWLDGEELPAAAIREQARAGRFAALGRRLGAAGEQDAAAGCYRASDRAAYVAHHALASSEADPHLGMVRCAVLIAERLAGDTRAPEHVRDALAGMVLCPGVPAWQW